MKALGRFAHGILFGVAAFVATFFWFVACFVALIPAPRTARFARLTEAGFGWTLLWLAGARLVVEGRERIDPKVPRVYVANHASFLDPPALMAGLPAPIRFVLKKQLVWLPFIGWYAGFGGHFFIEREDPRSGKAVLRRAVDRMRRRRLSLAVFPEGTRSEDGLLQPFRMGSFEPAVVGGFDVQPVAILGSHEILPKHALAPRRRGRITLRFGEPIPVPAGGGGAERRLLGERCRAALLALGVPEGTPRA